MSRNSSGSHVTSNWPSSYSLRSANNSTLSSSSLNSSNNRLGLRSSNSLFLTSVNGFAWVSSGLVLIKSNHISAGGDNRFSGVSGSLNSLGNYWSSGHGFGEYSLGSTHSSQSFNILLGSVLLYVGHNSLLVNHGFLEFLVLSLLNVANFSLLSGFDVSSCY